MPTLDEHFRAAAEFLSVSTGVFCDVDRVAEILKTALGDAFEERDKEIARLRERLKVPNPERDFVNEANDLLAAKNNYIAELERENEALRRDAERYRPSLKKALPWLEWLTRNGDVYSPDFSRHDYSEIDAAMKEQK